MSSSAVPPCSVSTPMHPLLQREFTMCFETLLNGVLKADGLACLRRSYSSFHGTDMMAILHKACMMMFVGECFHFNCKSHKISGEDGKPYQEDAVP